MKLCGYCGNEILNKNTQFCSKKCYSNNVVKKAEDRKVMCLNCNKKVGRNFAKYCSIKCRKDYCKKEADKKIPNCLRCGKKTNHKNRRFCSVFCAGMNNRRQYHCLICIKEVKRTIKICSLCRYNKYDKILGKYDIALLRENIKTKNFCKIHLNFYSKNSFCNQCDNIDKLRNQYTCKCGLVIPKGRTLCRKCLHKKFNNKEGIYQ